MNEKLTTETAKIILNRHKTSRIVKYRIPFLIKKARTIGYRPKDLSCTVKVRRGGARGALPNRGRQSLRLTKTRDIGKAKIVVDKCLKKFTNFNTGRSYFLTNNGYCNIFQVILKE